MKGEIQEFSNSEISIGRYPSCHAQFPKDLRIVSREHARIIREGNRFKLINHSKNGTYLNGKRIPEAYLKDGDVLIFAQGVPKVSFLTKVEEGGRHEEAKKDDKFDFGVQKKQIPLVIRYGPILRQFKKSSYYNRLNEIRSNRFSFSIGENCAVDHHAPKIMNMIPFPLNEGTYPGHHPCSYS